MKGLFKSQLLISRDEKIGEIVNTIVNRSEKKFICQICSKNFSSKHCLKEHGYTHTNERPYSCNFCNKIFKHASQLSLHKKTHRVKAELVWPKLTNLLKVQPKIQMICEIPIQVVNLPLISTPQEFSLPRNNLLY